MDKDLRNFTDRELKLMLEFAETMVERKEQNDFAKAGDPDDLSQAETQARGHIYRRKNNVRHIDDAEDAAIRKQVRTYLRRKGVIKD